jgi:hypothetical protein
MTHESDHLPPARREALERLPNVGASILAEKIKVLVPNKVLRPEQFDETGVIVTVFDVRRLRE